LDVAVQQSLRPLFRIRVRPAPDCPRIQSHRVHATRSALGLRMSCHQSGPRFAGECAGLPMTGVVTSGAGVVTSGAGVATLVLSRGRGRRFGPGFEICSLMPAEQLPTQVHTGTKCVLGPSAASLRAPRSRNPDSGARKDGQAQPGRTLQQLWPQGPHGTEAASPGRPARGTAGHRTD
jgi:hypothetical protein